MPISDYQMTSSSSYNPIRYESDIEFKYGDRVIISWNEWPDDGYTVQSANNNARFYDGLKWTVVGLSYDYNRISDNSIVEVMYEVELDIWIWWADRVYILQRHLEPIDGDIDEEEEYEDEIDDEDLEDFIDTAIITLKDYEWKDWEKSYWNKHLIKALEYAKDYLNNDC
jgi:hypothetical protein